MTNTEWLREDEWRWLSLTDPISPTQWQLNLALCRLTAERQKVAELVEALRKIHSLADELNIVDMFSRLRKIAALASNGGK